MSKTQPSRAWQITYNVAADNGAKQTARATFESCETSLPEIDLIAKRVITAIEPGQRERVEIVDVSLMLEAIPVRPAPYFTLVVRWNDELKQPWTIEFGDYDKRAAVAERDEYRANQDIRAAKIIKTESEDNALILAAVAKLNGR